MNENKESYSSIKNSKGQKIVFLVLFAAVALTMVVIFRYMLWPLLTAIVLYITFKPLHEFISRRIKSPVVSTAIVIALVLLFVIVPVIFLMMQLADQTLTIYKYVSMRIEPEDIQNFIYRNEQLKKLLAYLSVKEKDFYVRTLEYIQSSSLNVFTTISNAVGFSISFAINFVFTIILLTFMFLEWGRLATLVYKILPFPQEVEAEIFTRLKNVVKVVVVGNLFIMILQGFAVALVFAFFGFDVWLVAACAAAVFSLIPGVGTSVVWIPGAVYLAMGGNYPGAVILAVWSLVWYLILENLLKPHIFGKQLNFHPLLLFFLLIGSLMTFKLPGIIIGPVLLTAFFSLWEIYLYLDLYSADSSEKK